MTASHVLLHGKPARRFKQVRIGHTKDRNSQYEAQVVAQVFCVGLTDPDMALCEKDNNNNNKSWGRVCLFVAPDSFPT